MSILLWNWWQWSRYVLLALAVLLSLLWLFVVLTPQGRAGFHTALFVLAVLDTPVDPQPWFTSEPLRQEVTYPQPTSDGVADIYRIPDDKKRAAVLLFLGAVAAGRDDPDVVNLGNALARAGYVAMFHWSPTMALQYNIDPDELENLVWAFQHLEAQDFVDRNRVGVGGFSVGASFALVAAADPKIRDDVKFVNAFGPYYDARDLLVQAASRSQIFQEQIVPWDVDQLTLRVLANELIETLPDPQEQDLLRRQYVDGGHVPAADPEDLSPEARKVQQLIEGTTIEAAEQIYQTLPADFRQDMMRVSPSAYVEDVQGRLLIMHDQADELIPVAESRRLAQALKDRQDFRYTEMLIFEHVRPRSGGDVWVLAREGLKLYRHMYDIIRIAA